MSPRVFVLVGARPNFVKVAPVIHALKATGEIGVDLIHTEQHYDHSLSGAFLDQLRLPSPKYALGVGSGTHAEQTAAAMVGVERILVEEQIDALIVAGDVNSTLAGALAASKVGVPVVHVESGLRSNDWSMPEEVNRVLTDRLSSLLLCHCEDAVENLRSEGIAEERIAMVGNTMIDSLFNALPAARATKVGERLDVDAGNYVLVTLHRPSLVDDSERLSSTLTALEDTAVDIPVLFPTHPRTRRRIPASPRRVRLLDPLDYLEFIALEADARLVVTDSGGVQEETSALGVQCLTFRSTTERPITIASGTNELVDGDADALRAACERALARPRPLLGGSIPLWDGQAGPRAAAEVLRFLDPEAVPPQAHAPDPVPHG
jgi:UDP-N-acetylglucosamine 2-epimerase (non-hydrolysing)